MSYAGRVVQRTHNMHHHSNLNQTTVTSVRLHVSKMLIIAVLQHQQDAF